MKKIKLSQWAKNHDVCYKTAWLYFKAGRFGENVEVTDKGSIFVLVEEVKEENEIQEKKVLELSDILTAIHNLGEIIKNK